MTQSVRELCPGMAAFWGSESPGRGESRCASSKAVGKGALLPCRPGGRPFFLEVASLAPASCPLFGCPELTGTRVRPGGSGAELKPGPVWRSDRALQKKG